MKILMINTCDEWKSKESMRFCGAIKEEQLLQTLIDMIKNDIIQIKDFDISTDMDSTCSKDYVCNLVEEFSDEDCCKCQNYITKEEVINKELSSYLLLKTPEELNNSIDYLYIYETTLGEVETNGSYLY